MSPVSTKSTLCSSYLLASLVSLLHLGELSTGFGIVLFPGKLTKEGLVDLSAITVICHSHPYCSIETHLTLS